LKAPGFNPRNYKVEIWFQSLLFQILNLYRYTAGSGAGGGTSCGRKSSA
jgi:hypothetical protein